MLKQEYFELGDAFAFERLTVDNNANGVACTANTYAPSGATAAKAARMVCDTQPISYREDGQGAPVAAQCVQRAVGDEWLIWGINNIKAFRAIRNNAANGYIAVTYYR